MPQLFSTSRAEAELYRFPTLFYPVVMVLALVLQAYLPHYLGIAKYMDMPLLVVAYVALTTRNQATAMLVGCTTGLLEDMLANVSLGINGIAQTVGGYVAASLGVRVDAEHPGVRLLVVFGLFWIDRTIVAGIHRFLMARPPLWSWPSVTLAAFINGMFAIFLFRFFDRFRNRY